MRRCERLLDLPEPPTAVATSTDLVAVGVLHAAHSLGATVPDKLSVVGFDDILIATHTVPALTTFRMPIAEIVSHAINLAVDAGPRSRGRPRAPSLEIFAPDADRSRIHRAAARLSSYAALTARAGP